MKLKVSFEVPDDLDQLQKIPEEKRDAVVIETVSKILKDIGAVDYPQFQFDIPVLFTPKEDNTTEIEYGNLNLGIVSEDKISLDLLQVILSETGVNYDTINIPKNIYPITG